MTAAAAGETDTEAWRNTVELSSELEMIRCHCLSDEQRRCTWLYCLCCDASLSRKSAGVVTTDWPIIARHVFLNLHLFANWRAFQRVNVPYCCLHHLIINTLVGKLSR